MIICLADSKAGTCPRPRMPGCRDAGMPGCRDAGRGQKGTRDIRSPIPWDRLTHKNNFYRPLRLPGKI